MASSTPTCDICSSQRKSSPAEIWCLECEESLCVNCSKQHAVSKSSRNHDTLSITEYTSLPDFITKIEKHCSKHNEHYTVYCHDHDCPACTSCVLEIHKHCSQVSRVDTVVGNAKSSATLTDIEELLREVSKTIYSLQAERKNNVASLQGQKNQIENDISSFRQKINELLDKMQLRILDDLHKSEKKECEKIGSVLQSLSVQKSELEELQQNIVSTKKHASDLQAFFAIREIEKCSNELSKKITDMSEAGEFNIVIIKHYKQNRTVLSDLSSVDFGTIVTEVSPSNVKIKLSKEKQDQLPVTIQPSNSIELVSAKLKRTFNTGCQNTRGCVILPDGRSLFTCYKNGTVTCIDKDRNQENVKLFKSSSVCEIGYSEDMNKIYTSSGSSGLTEIHQMNLNGGNIKSINTKSNNFGIVVKQHKLIYCAAKKGLCEWSLSGGSVRVIVSDPSLPVFCYVTEYRDQLYFTKTDDNSVTCCGMDGSQIWKNTNIALKRPHSTSVDNNGNVYVVGTESENVVVISADGQRHREILSTKDGLIKPQVLYYQRSTNQLLVANRENKAFLFDVSFT